MQALSRRMGIGVLWNLAGIVLGRGATVVFTIFLARLLAPEAFGLIAMVTVVFELAGALVQSGLGQALVRSKQVSELDLATVFLANMGLAVLAYAAVWLAAPAVAAFYGQPALASLVQVMGTVVFLQAASVVPVAVLCRAMDFRVQAQAQSLAVLVAGVLAVLAALQGAGVWSLVIQLLVSALLSTLLLWRASRWRPRLQFSAESFTRLFRFGAHLLAEGLLDVLFQNAYILVIGRFFSAELTGLYFFARKLSNLVAQQLTAAVQQATYPGLATLQDDTAALRGKYRQVIQLMMFMIAPVMLLLAGLAEPLFALLFDERWRGAVPYMQLLCIVGLLYPLHALNINILNVTGRSDLVLKVGLVKKAVNLSLLLAAIPFGVLGIVTSQVIGSVLALLPNTYFSARLVGYGLREQLLDACRPVLAALLAALLAWGLLPWLVLPLLLQLCLAALAGVLAYVLASLVLRAEGLQLLLAMVRRYRHGVAA